jgi:GTPase Era involved in 16S rRNA processing
MTFMRLELIIWIIMITSSYGFRIVLIGEPGVGKSLLGNIFCGIPVFKTGISTDLSGLTKVTQVCDFGGYTLVDNPGINDAIMGNQKTREEILNSLKKEDDYLVVHVVTLESGRARPFDIVTHKIIKESLSKINDKILLLVNRVNDKIGETELIRVFKSHHIMQVANSERIKTFGSDESKAIRQEFIKAAKSLGAYLTPNDVGSMETPAEVLENLLKEAKEELKRRPVIHLSGGGGGHIEGAAGGAIAGALMGGPVGALVGAFVGGLF